jgi:tripartite-type tricarboxylate transporter receptor subunit TctC
MTALARLVACLAALAAALAPGVIHAQAFPAKAVRLIVPFPAGGPADIFGRTLAQGMGGPLGQTVVVENVSGMSGVLGVDRAAKAPADGYTLALISSSAASIGPFAMAKMPFDPAKDLGLVTTVVRVPEVLTVNPALAANTLGELVAHLKANPGRLNYGSAGPGIFDVPVLLPHIRAGKLRALAITSGRRAATLPEVPTTAEAGYPKLLSDNWYGLVTPPALPPAVLRRIHAAALAALGSKAVAEQYAKVGGVPMPSSPEEFAVYLAHDQAKWSGVVKAIGFKAE